MLLAKEFIAYLSRQVVTKVSPLSMEAMDPEAATETVSYIITEELQVEDRLNDEVREILSQYSDYMKLSRDKINDISHKLVTGLRQSRAVRVKKPANEVRLELVRIITDLLQTEDKVDRAARQKIRSQKREIPEGSEEWDLLLKRYYAEELKKLGIDLSR